MVFFKRLAALSLTHSFFLFGARGTGKSTLLRETFPFEKALYINLLDPSEEDRFARNPNELQHLVNNLSPKIQFVIVDEVQKVPKLLDVVHLLIETHPSKKIYILTGSSARRLKMAGVNLLAGRAFVYNLYPLSYLELNKKFHLEEALRWGLLPKLYSLKTSQEKLKFLQAYSLTYLKEEVWGEQLIRKLEPFRKFLEVAAQSNGKMINFNNIARDVGANDKTVKSYFSILEDTLLGFMLEPFHHSFRKRLRLAPKFYFCDGGIARAVAKTLSLNPTPGTSYYGDLFEAFVIVECVKLATYFQPEFKFSYLMTAAGVEVDLVVERPGQKTLFIEIKSKPDVNAEDLSSLEKIATDFGQCEAVCFSQDPRKKKIGSTVIYPWQQGIKAFFMGSV